MTPVRFRFTFRSRVMLRARIGIGFKRILRLRPRSFAPGQVLNPEFIQARSAAFRVGKTALLLHHRLLTFAHVMPGDK